MSEQSAKISKYLLALHTEEMDKGKRKNNYLS